MSKLELIPIGIYDRVSTAKQEAGAARPMLTAAARARGGRVALYVEETGSGARNDRPGLQRILAAARRGEVREVLVYKLDRFGRSTLDVLTNIRQLRDVGCSFVAVSQGLSVMGNDAVSTLMLTILAACSTFETDLIRDRTIMGLERARRRGVVLGRPRAEGPDPDQVLQLRTQGESWSDIADLLGCPVSQARRAITASSLAKKGTKPPRREMA